MASLTGCAKSIGLPDEELSVIRSLAKNYRDDGFSAADANIEAAKEYLSQQQQASAEIVSALGLNNQNDAYDDKLIIQHNTTEQKLMHAAKMGGLPVPSLAVTKSSDSMTNFGEITLIGHKEMADPKGYAKTKVFGADIYSPRYPTVHYKFGGKAEKILDAIVAKHADKTGYNYIDMESLNSKGIQYLKDFEPMMADFLTSKDIKFKPVTYKDNSRGTIGEVDRWATRNVLRDTIKNSNNWDEYETYVEGIFESLNPEERLFKGFTYSGKRSYKPHTLENVVKILKKELRGGESIGNLYGIGQLRAKFTPQFKSVTQIKNSKDKLVTKEQFEKIKEEVDAEFFEIADEAASFYQYDANRFGFHDTVLSMIEDAARKGISRASREYDFRELSDEVKEKIAGFVTRLRNMPTEYFEAKILREVDIAEFAAAVVPEKISTKARGYLESRGLKIFTYSSTEERKRAVHNAAKSMDNKVLFQSAMIKSALDSEQNVSLDEGPIENPVFYSKLHKTVEEAKQDKATPEQWMGILKNSGVKEEELEWTGLEAWMKSVVDANVKTVPKQWMLDHIKSNTARIEIINRTADHKLMRDGNEYNPDDNEVEFHWSDFVREEPDTSYLRDIARGSETFSEKYDELRDGKIKEFLEENELEDEADIAVGDMTAIEEEADMEAEDYAFQQELNFYYEDPDAPITATIRATYQGEWYDIEVRDSYGQVELYSNELGLDWEVVGRRLDMPLIESKIVEAMRDQGIYKEDDEVESMGDQKPEKKDSQKVRGLESHMKDRYGNSRWTYRGGKAYHETVLTMPGQIDEFVPDSMHFTEEGGGTAVAWLRADIRQDKEGNDTYFIQEVQSKRHMMGREDGYRDQEAIKKLDAELNKLDVATDQLIHGIVENDLAKYKTVVQGGEFYEIGVGLMDNIGLKNSIRTTFNNLVKGKHRKSEYGYLEIDPETAYYDKEESRGYNDKYISLMDTIPIERAREYLSLKNKIDEANYRRTEMRKGVPDAPFKKTWQLLTLKAAIHNAVIMGAKKVTWSPGAMQAERYNLRQAVETIRYQKNEDGSYMFQAKNKHGLVVHSEAETTPEKMRELIGSRLTGMIVNNEGGMVADTALLLGQGKPAEIAKGSDLKIVPIETNHEDNVYEINGRWYLRTARTMSFEKKEIALAYSEMAATRHTLSYNGKPMDSSISFPNKYAAEDYISRIEEYFIIITDRGMQMDDAVYTSEEQARKEFDKRLNALEHPEYMPHEIKGETLEIGGEGLIDLYDKMLPKIANQYLKKFGTNVAVHEMRLYDSDIYQETGFEKKYQKQLGFVITPELEEYVLSGQPLFQKTMEERGSLAVLDNQRIIKLGAASDLSTFLHEAGHLFLEMEKSFAFEYGASEQQVTMLKWLGLKSFDELDINTAKGREAHEKWARGFEAYLREGKAPSLALRDAFAAFARWLKRIYQNIKMLDVELNHEIRDVFDRMLASEEEIALATANPAYDQFFRTKEQAGMSDEEWEKYTKRATRVIEQAEQSLDEKLLKELYKRKSAEWKEEKLPLIAEEKERLSQQRVYQVLSDLSAEPMDYDQVLQILGEKKMPGRLIGKAKKGGRDPNEYAEVYGYPSADAMLKDILGAPTLNEAADKAAEARMVAKYGDILNDGTIEQEAREAVHNDEQIKLLLDEIKAFGRKTGRPTINRQYLKNQAKDMIGSMKYAEIDPTRYYRAEIKAAQNAVLAKTDEERYAAKVQQLANHYLYKEASEAKRDVDKYRKYIRDVQDRSYSPKNVKDAYIQNMKTLASMYDARYSRPEYRELKRENFASDQEYDKAVQDQSAIRIDRLDYLLNWYMTQIADPNEYIKIELLDPNLVMALQAKQEGRLAEFNLPTYKDLTVDDLRGVYEMLKHLRYVGGKMADQDKAEFQAEKKSLVKSIEEHGGRDRKTPDEPRKGDGWISAYKNFMHRLANVRNMTLRLDGMNEDGEAYRKIFKPIDDANNVHIDMNRRIAKQFREELKDMVTLGIGKSDKKTVKRELTGTDFTLSSEGRVMLALYWGTQSSREAIMEGHQITEGDVETMLSFMTEPELQLVNKIWKMNETLWPELSELSVNLYGVAPVKLDPTPFEVKGVKMTGGHMRLYYEGTNYELSEQVDKLVATAPISQTKAGSLHERVGSGGKRVRLSKDNISTAMNENIHAIAFGRTTMKVAGYLNSRETKDVIVRKYGQEFYDSLLYAIDGVLTIKREQNYNQMLAMLARQARTAATYMHLAYSIRNTLQQVSAIPIAAREVGHAKLMYQYTKFITEPKKYIDEVKKLSKFMEHRSTVVNREATEQLAQISEGGKWNTFKQYGFVMQTAADMLIAYPTWMAKFSEGIEQHGEIDKAVSDADRAVAYSVGSGQNLDLGAMFQTKRSELTKMFTVFGSWFNSQYQRIYRAYYRGDRRFDLQFAETILVSPFLSGMIAALIILDTPADDEEWYEWAARIWSSNVIAVLPIVREIAAAFKGFTAKNPVGAQIEAVVNAFRSVGDMIQGEKGFLETASKVGKGVGTVVPLPGVGQVTRMAEYWDSYEQGNEGDFNPYQMVMQGKSRD